MSTAESRRAPEVDLGRGSISAGYNTSHAPPLGSSHAQVGEGLHGLAPLTGVNAARFGGRLSIAMPMGPPRTWTVSFCAPRRTSRSTGRAGSTVFVIDW